MKVDIVEVVTRKQVRRDNPEFFEQRIRRKIWQLLFINVWQQDENNVRFIWQCVFTPWRLFATFFVKNSKYYKARMEPW